VTNRWDEEDDKEITEPDENQEKEDISSHEGIEEQAQYDNDEKDD